MATTDKDLIRNSATYCREQGEEALGKALNFATIAGGSPESSEVEFRRAGSFFAAAEVLEARLK